MISNRKYATQYSSAEVILVVILMTLSAFTTDAQDLEYLPPVINMKTNKDSGSTLILGTVDYARFVEKQEKVHYINSLQIIDAAKPWPPKWYAATQVYHEGMPGFAYVQIGYPKTDSNHFFFLCLTPPHANSKGRSAGDKFEYNFVVLDKAMKAIDTINTPFLYGGTYGPNFRTNAKIARLTMTEMDSTLNLSSITGNKKDTAVESNFWIIQILDEKGKVKFSWNPLFHMDPKLLQIKEQIEQLSQSGQSEIKWKKINNVYWDYDGDILYSSEAGIGKISKKDGHVIWHIDCSNIPFREGVDTLICFSPSAFLLDHHTDRTATYSFFERGVPDLSQSRGVIFEQDKVTLKVKNVKYISPQEKFTARHGWFNYNPKNGYYVMDYGVFEKSDTAENQNWETMEYGVNGKALAVYQLPQWNYTFGMQRLEDFPVPPRPTISRQGDLLYATGGMKNYVWYKLEGSDSKIITKVGTGSNIKPEKGAIYCVTSPYGVGFSVSEIYK